MPSLFHPLCARRGWGWIALLLFAAPPFASPQEASTPARSTPLLLPSGIAYDTAGRLYIAETRGNAIRRVDNSGNMATFAGTGTQGFSGDGGQATSAELDSPQGLAVDSSGDVYVADSGNNRIRRVDGMTGVMTSVAGVGKAGFSGDGGAAVSASLDLPRAVCLDQSGMHLYVADSRNHRIREIDLATGVIGTVAGNGRQGFSGDGASATAASLDSPESLAVDASGDLYLADTHNQRVRRIDAATRTISTILGTGAVGVAVSGAAAVGAQVALPRGLTVDRAGDVYVVESGNHRVVRVDHATGLVTVAAGAGTEGFGGDNGPAVLAGLDSPRAAALTPGGLLAISDTGDQRVRQLVADPAPGTGIETVAGLGAAAATPGVFSLSAPSVIAYGSGSVTATLTGSVGATGTVTFLDVGGGASAVIGVGTLAANSAAVSLGTISAGQHHILATYAGDGTHLAAETSTMVVTVSPLALTAVAATATMVYGTAPPSLSGSLNGVLAQDAGRVSASFSTTATSTSPSGAYPIAVMLSGAAAGNYVVQPVSASLVVAPANSSTVLTQNSSPGSVAAALTATVGSATSGVPGGRVSLLDNGSMVQTGSLSAGAVAFSAPTLSTGTHVLSAVYAGDQNFLPSTSPSLTLTISAAPAADFAIAATGAASQTLIGAGSVTYNLSVSTSGGLSSPIALTVSGLPAFTTTSFSPSYLPPGGSSPTAVVLTVTSTAMAAKSGGSQRNSMGGSGVALACSIPFAMLVLGRRRSLRGWRLPRLMALGVLPAMSFGLTGCGDRVNSSAPGSSPLKSYTLTITGTSTTSSGTTLQHSATVVLQMGSAS